MTIPATEPGFSGCLWPLDPACLSDDWEALEDTTQERAQALASATLQRLTGNRVSNCPITVRPCKEPDRNAHRYTAPYTSAFGTTHYLPHVSPLGNWVNFCHHASDCDCCSVRLPSPIGRVDEVRVDGSVVAPSDYRVDNRRELVWQGAGDCPWPQRQDLSRSVTEPNTFSVTYLNAYPPDSLAAYAAGVLAMEYAKACTNSKCRLPAGVTTIVRQGVTFEVASGAFPDGLTGIREVDGFIAMWNPRGLSRQSAVWSPDWPVPHVPTWGG